MEQRVRRRVLDSQFETVATVCDAGSAVADSWPDETVSDSACITDPLQKQLDESGLGRELLDVLLTAVKATGRELQGKPVPAPPYLVVTSRGPVCRGTLDDGHRLLVEFELFDVQRRPRTYAFLDPSPATCLSVRLR